MSESVVAAVKNLIFESKDSPYKVIKGVDSEDNEVIFVGEFPQISLNLTYEFTGEFVNHPKFNKQFKVQTFKRVELNTKEGIVLYLSSEIFKGIGEKTATKIYEALGEDCINKIVENKNVLNKVKGLTPKTKDYLYETIIENRNIEEKFVSLYKFGLTPKMANKLYDMYKDTVIEKIKENPYRLIYEIEGFGFKKTDTLALSMGFDFKNKIRIEEGILYTINYVCNSKGYTYLTEIQVINSAIKLLNDNLHTDEAISEDDIKSGLNALLNANTIISIDKRIYLKYLYENEKNLAKRITEIKNSNNIKNIKQEYILDLLKNLENVHNISYTLSQREAIINSINSNISIITGGPGTGKTTIIRAILEIFAKVEKRSLVDREFQEGILLMAPTGRAAKRMHESTGVPAKTIHKALGYTYDNEFLYNEDNKLGAKLIIIDESSMIDTNLAASLFNAISNYTKVIIVGDEFQLPSVGPGNFLHDLIISNKICISRLNEIMRQSSDSNIIKLSLDIKNNNIKQNIFKERKEVFFYNSLATEVVEKILIFIEAFINKGGDLQNDLEVLVPMYSGICGIDAINYAIQNKFNNESLKIVRGKKVFKLNDKVLQLVNEETLGIMNGDIGIIKEIVDKDDDSYLLIDFDGVMVKYPTKDLDNLTLAYAISIHKSQGSEYKNVIMPIVNAYYVMLKKQLIYTGVTRAKEKLILVGDYKSLILGVESSDEIRQTTLSYFLNDQVYHYYKKINDPNIPFETLGEKGMENITPYTFLKRS